MAKRRVKKCAKKSISSSPGRNANDANVVDDTRADKKEDALTDLEVERQSAAIRAIRDIEIEHLRTSLRLLHTYFDKEQLQTPVLQYFEDNLSNLSVLRNEKDGQFEVRWKDKDAKFFMNQAAGSNMHASLLRQMSMSYLDCSTMPSFCGLDFSSKTVKTSFLGANDLQINDFVLEDPSDTQMTGLQTDAFQTPGMNSNRQLSVGMTPKTLRLPKHGEMLLSVHGSPLGVYKKEDNMEAINEAEES